MDHGGAWGRGTHFQAPPPPGSTSIQRGHLPYLSIASHDPALPKSCLTHSPHRTACVLCALSKRHESGLTLAKTCHSQLTRSALAASSQHASPADPPRMPLSIVERAHRTNPAWQLKQVQVAVLHPAPRCSKPQCKLCPTQRTISKHAI